MLAFLLTAAFLFTATIAAAWVGMNWPDRRRDLLTAAIGATAVAMWVTFNQELAGPVLARLAEGHGVHLADLAGLPALSFSGLLVGRTILLSRETAAAHAHALHSAALHSTALTATRASQDSTSVDTDAPDASAEAKISDADRVASDSDLTQR